MGSPIGAELPFEMISLLRQLSAELVQAQLDPANQLKPATIITKAAPLVRARLHLIGLLIES